MAVFVSRNESSDRLLGAPGSAEIWRGFDNSLVDDGNAISTQLLDSTNVLETYEENNPSLSNPNAIPLGDRAEWDWVVQNNSAPTDTYVFRMIRDNGELLDGYVNFPQLTTVEPALVQRDFQWYPSSSVLNPATSTALAPVNGAATGAVPGAAFRIRMNVEASGFDLPATAQSFNLQFANTTTGPWTDVGLLGSEGIWRGSDNAGLSDGATVSPILPSSDVGESYEEENPSVLNPNTILATTTQRGEWDWAIEDRLAPSGTFFFRMVREDGTTLDDYTNFPEIAAAGPSLAQEDYRWFANLDSTAPGSALAGENTLFTATEHVDTYRLRMNVEVANSALIAGAQSFKLQYATSTPGPWSDVGAVGSNSDWWGFDNPSPADGSLITTVLASSTVAATYEEFNPSVPNPNPVGAGDRAEWDWVLQPALVDSETTYYFRMVRAGGETLEVYTLFPSLTTPKALVLTQQDYRWFANTSTTTIPFVALSGENTSTTGAVPGDVFRLRMNVNVAGADMGAGSQAFKLQFTTSTSAPAGPWTDVGALPPLQIGLDAVSSNSAGGGANTLTISHTVGSQPNRVLVVGAEGEDNSSTDCVATGVTYGGVALTNVAEAVAGTSPFMCVSLWYLVAPATGTADVVITWAGNVRRRNGGAISIFNAAQQGLEAQNSQALNAATTISTSINTVTEGTWVIDAVGGGTGTAFTPLAPNQIEQYDIQEGSSRGAGSTKHVPTAGPTAMSWTKTGNYLAHVVAAFAPFAEEQTFTEIWRGFDNPSLDDGETLTSSTLVGTTVVQSYEEVNPSVPNPNPAVATTTERAEWDWVVQHNGAPAGSYVFRMVRDNGVPLNTYVNFPEIESALPDFIQHDYRWFANVDGAATTTGWETLADTPANVRFGGAMTTDGTDLYALRGAGLSDFWRYDISAGNWVPLANTPGTVSQGGAVEFAGGHVYALRGASTQDFWRYDILGDTWEVRAATPANVDWGGSLAWDGGDSIYALRGDVSTAFWVYSISGNSWASLAGTLANVSNGGSLAYVTGDLYALRGDNTTDFWKYTTSTNTWSALTSTPAIVNNGGSLAWDGEQHVYALRGAQSTAFWRYSTSTDSWEVLPNTLMIVDDGGSLSFLGGAGYALRGDNNSDFWVFGIAPSTPLADENTPFTADIDGPVYRLRMNVEVTTVDMPTGTHRFKLQYALTSTGPWTDVGAVGSRSLSEDSFLETKTATQ